MLPPPFQNALVLTGPTGSGKTGLAIELAQGMDAEIISMDSMAIYRGMDIGTAKPSRAEQAAVPHHLIDVLDPWESASVAWWLDQAKRCCQEIEARGKQVLVVGGTPLYLKALLCGLFEGPAADESIRHRLTEEARLLGSATIHERLARIDPTTADRIHPNDVRRIVRALEVFELTGKPMSEHQTQWAKPTSELQARAREVASPLAGASGSRQGPIPDVLCLDLSREELYSRIDQRVETMFAAGLVEEARGIRTMQRPLSREASRALGYCEIFDFLDGRIEAKEAIVRVQTRSRNLAKRQLTWFRHLPGIQSTTRALTWTHWGSRMKR